MSNTSFAKGALASALRHLRPVEARIGVTALAAAFVLVSAQTVLAHEYKAGSLEIVHPWARATPPGAAVGGGYTTIKNEGDEADRLVSASAEIADKTEIHEMKVEDGVMKMSPLPDGIEIPAHETVKLAPGGFHIMFMHLKGPLKQGERIPGTLTFEKAGTVKVEFAVEAIGATAPGGESDHGSTHDMKNMNGMKMDGQ